MSYWNYRVLASKFKEETYFIIHEVYYDNNNTPTNYGTAILGGENIKGIRWQLNRVKECLNKPILWEGENFPNEYKEE